jgi:predicted nucleic acid-binding protein
MGGSLNEKKQTSAEMPNYFLDSNVVIYALWPDQHTIKAQLAYRLIVQPNFIYAAKKI